MTPLEKGIVRAAKRQDLRLWPVGPRVAISRIAGERGEVTARLMDHGGMPDFIGLYGPGGRFLGLEAKSTQLPRLPLDNFRPLQLVWLKKIEQAGGLAGVIAEIGARTAAPSFFLLPLALLLRFYEPWRRAGEGYGPPAAASIPAATLAAEAIPVAVIRGGLDLAGALDRLEQQGQLSATAMS